MSNFYQEIKADANAALNLRAAGADVSLIGVPGTNPAGNNLTLKGWPLTGLDQLRSGFLQQKAFMQSPQPLHHLQFLTPQQQQLLLQAQQNMTSSPGEMDSRRLRMLLSSRNMIPGRDGQSNAFAEIIPSVGPSLQNMCSPVQRMETDMLMKRIAALQQHQQSSNQQQLLQHPLLSQQPQRSNHHPGQQEKMGAGSVTMDGSLSNSFRGNEQASKNQNGRKRKQPISSSGPANSSGTANTTGPSPSSAPSTPSTHTPGDTISMPSMHHNASLSKALVVYGTDAPGTIGSPTNQLVGSTVLLLSAKYPNKDQVAYASLLSCNPSTKVGGVELGNQFWKVRINHFLRKTEALVRPLDCCKSIDDVHAKGMPIAWPSICVRKING